MNLLKNLSIYTVSSLVSRAMPFFLLPVMTAYLSPVQYGIVAVVTALVALVSSPLFFGTHSYVNVEYFGLDRHKHEQLVSTLCWVPILLFVPITLAFWVYAYLGGSRFEIPVLWFVAIPFLALLTFLYRLLTVLYRVKEEARKYALVEVCYSLLQVVLAVSLVVLLNLGVEGRLFSMLLSSIVISVICGWQLWKMGYLSSYFNFRVVPAAIGYGVKLIPHELGQQTIRMADRLFVAWLVGTSAAGLYAVAAQVASIAVVFISVFNLAWQPHVFRTLSSGSNESKRNLAKLSLYVVGGFLAFFILLNASLPYIYDLFIAEEYVGSINYVRWLLLGYFFVALYTLVCDYIFYAKKTGYLSMITGVNLILMVSLSVILIENIGAIGAAYSFAAASFATFLLAFALSGRVCRMQWLAMAK